MNYQHFKDIVEDVCLAQGLFEDRIDVTIRDNSLYGEETRVSIRQDFNYANEKRIVMVEVVLNEGSESND